MNLATLEITTEEAEERVEEYSKLIASERTAEDDAILAGYRAAKRGLPIIRLASVIQAGGVFPSGRPRIAVVRADATECHVALENTGLEHWDVIYSGDGGASWQRHAQVGQNHVRVTIDRPEHSKALVRHGKTVVPIIPPRHRPRRNRIRGCHILWEVERWDPTPPVDPALIRHIRGDLWSVLAVWDLTDLERSVLSARL